MSSIKSFQKLMIVLIVVSLFAAIPGVHAYWFYSDGAVDEISNSVSLNYFPWEGSGDVSDEGEDGETSQLAGMNVVIDALNNVGLTGESQLNQYIKKRVQNFNKLEYGSVDAKQDAVALLNDITTLNPNFQFILTGKIAGSGKNKYVEYFYMYMIANEDFDAAMAAWESSGISESDYESDPSILQEYFYPVTRVLIEKDAYDKWAPSSAEIGYCGFGYYEGSNNGGGQKVWTFKTSSWQAGAPPT